MPKDRGAEQGDVDGSFACSLALGMVPAEARVCVAVQQAARNLPWIGTRDSLHERRLQDEQRNRMQRIRNFQLGGVEKSLQTSGLQRMVTFSVTDDWFCPISKGSPQLTLKLEQNEPHRKQKSSTTSQTCKLLLLSR